MRPRGLNEQQLAMWIATNAIMQEDGCWICPWGNSSYPQIGVNDGVAGREGVGPMRVHVLMHRVVNTLDPTTPQRPMVLHSCGVTRCVSPAHLRAGSGLENTQDAIGHGHMVQKLTDDDVRAIRVARANNVPLSTLRKQYGVDASLISRIGRRLARATVPD